MSANVETMFSVREKPWHGLGEIVAEAPTSADALHLAGLDWRVKQTDVLSAETGEVITGYKANVRDTDSSVLGIVTDRYKIVQNVDAFAFTDVLVSDNCDVHYETAGSLRGGRTVWLLAKLPKTELAGDEVEQYVCFANTHDGTGAVRVCVTPVRVVCNNTLNFALKTAARSWSTKHTGDINSKILEAKETLALANSYMINLQEYANEMQKKPVTDKELGYVLNGVFQLPKKPTDREVATVQAKKDSYMACYFAPDIAKFRGTAWGALNAMADFADHAAPARMTASYRENNWGRIMNGHDLVDKMAMAFAA